MRKIIAGMLVAVILGLVAVVPAPAQAMEPCPEMAPTIQSLQVCVQHAAAMGVIDNAGVTHSLLKKLDAAQTAQENGKPRLAIHLLKAFINEVKAQSGKHIASEQALHMIMHAQQVIQAINSNLHKTHTLPS